MLASSVNRWHLDADVVVLGFGVAGAVTAMMATGGGRRNEHAHVLNPDGNPIPRLYEAGELGSVLSNLFHYGQTLTECMVFGRIAARHDRPGPAGRPLASV